MDSMTTFDEKKWKIIVNTNNFIKELSDLMKYLLLLGFFME